jgi:hypothetical protein
MGSATLTHRVLIRKFCTHKSKSAMSEDVVETKVNVSDTPMPTKIVPEVILRRIFFSLFLDTFFVSSQ